MKNIIKVLLAFFILASCATPYQKVGLSGGYSDTRLQDNVFTVNFRGNGYTSKERSSDFALLRCAELAIQNGFKFFSIADSSQEQKTMFYKTGSTSTTYGTTNIYGNTAYSNFNTYRSGSMIFPIRKPRASYTIFCFAEKPDENQMVFDANYLSQSIRQKYNMKAVSKTDIVTSIGKSITSDSKVKHDVDQTERLKSFLFLYCQLYESKDLDKFADFFDPDATENNRPFHELLPDYRRNMEMVESLNYRIELVDYSLQSDTGNVKIRGKFFTQYLLHGEALKEKTGNIFMELAKNGDSYLIKKLDYTSGSEKKVDNQSQWSPWIETGNKN